MSTKWFFNIFKSSLVEALRLNYGVCNMIEAKLRRAKIIARETVRMNVR